MTMLTSLGRSLAAHRERAQRITTVRHLHVSSTPMVFVPLVMAGEANAPLAALIGTDRDDPQLRMVAQPQNRDQRLLFAHELATLLFAELTPMSTRRVPVPGRNADVPRRCADAPQIWMPNRAGVEYVRLLGRSTRFRRSHGPGTVPANVPRMGKWLTFYAERAEFPGSSLLIPATAALSAHWATGQSSEEDEHLGTLLAWIEPTDGMTGAQAARFAEDPLDYPPAGPSTDPTFDNAVLEPLVQRYRRSANNPSERARVAARIEADLRSQLIGAWEQVWQAIDLISELTPGAHVAERWGDDLDSFTRTADWIATSTAAQRKRDLPGQAARRLHELERAQDRYDAQRAFDDPMVMAEARMIGEAFGGVITAVEPRRIERRNRPRVLIETSDPVRLEVGDDRLSSPSRPGQKAEVLSVDDLGNRLRLELELSGGMGNGREPKPGSVPAVGEELTYSLFTVESRRRPEFPRDDETPWTHGGPPPPAVPPTTEDAQEDWS